MRWPSGIGLLAELTRKFANTARFRERRLPAVGAGCVGTDMLGIGPVIQEREQEITLRPRHFGFQEIESLLEGVAGGASRQRARHLDGLNGPQTAVCADLVGFQPIERLLPGRHSWVRGCEIGGVLFQVSPPVSKDVPKKAAGLVIQVVAACQHAEPVLDGQAVEHLPLEETADRADFPPRATSDFLD